MGGSPGSVAGAGASGKNKVNIGAAPKAMSHTKVECNAPSGTPPSKGGQTSGEVIHSRSGSKVENFNTAPKSNSM